LPSPALEKEGSFRLQSISNRIVYLLDWQPSYGLTMLAGRHAFHANCHRMIHRFKPWKNVDEIAALLSDT